VPLGSVPAGGLTPSGEVASKESVDQALGSLDRLASRYATILRMRLVDGFSSDEIARALGLTRKQVQEAQCRGLARLREMLDGCGRDPR